MLSYAAYFLEWSLCFVLLGFALNILSGLVGINSLAMGALFGVGAYAFALTLKVSAPLGVLAAPLAFVAAMAVGALINIAIAVPTLRVSSAHFLVASLALQYLLYELFRNSGWTGGSVGVSGIGLSAGPGATHAVIVIVGILTIAVLHRVLRGRIGRLFLAIKDDEFLSRASGVSIFRGKVLGAALAGVVAGVAGSLFALNQTYIDPDSFDLHTTILVYAIVLIGGSGSFWGTIVGGLAVMLVPEALSQLALSPEYVGPLRRFMFGLALLLLLFLRPEGIIPRRPSVRAGVAGESP